MLIEIEPCLEAFKSGTNWTCPDQAGTRFGSGSGSRPLASSGRKASGARVRLWMVGGSWSQDLLA